MIITENWKKTNFKKLCKIILDIYPDAQLPEENMLAYLRSVPKVRIEIQNYPEECKTVYHLIGMGLLYKVRLGELPSVSDAPFNDHSEDVEPTYAFQIHPNQTGKIIRYKEPRFVALFKVSEPDDWRIKWEKNPKDEADKYLQQGRKQMKKLLKI